jgi:D-alanine-D-alanine ligase-like ATP-grasp enzyme
MKVCVLQPDYGTSAVDYRLYDPPRDLSALLPQHTVDHVALHKLTTYKQIKELSHRGYDIFVNLNEGYLEWDVPSIDVIHSLELFNLPYTGPPAHLYHLPKPLMKYVAYTAGVRTPAHGLVRDAADASVVASRLAYPLFVKPAFAGDSLGVDEHSLVRNDAELQAKVAAILGEYEELLVEEFIEGREFTVLVLGSTELGGACRALKPVEFIFPEGGSHFKTYALKTSDLHPSANVPVVDEAVCQQLQEAACKVFTAFGGVGYARMDFRMNAAGEIFFLEVNFTCSVFYSGGYEGSADYILRYDPLGPSGFAEQIIAEGLERHRRRQRRYRMQGNGVSGYGIFATEALARGDVIFHGEERAHRMVTKRHVMDHWPPDDRQAFRHYAVPLSSQVYALWDEDPLEWAPQNHSCAPNAAYQGLDIVALRDIASGEELTLDYAMMMNEQSEPFRCTCGAPTCRGSVHGAAGNSVTAREKARQP